MRTVQLSTWLPACLLLLSLPGQAAEWTAAPTLTLRTGYNDNIRLDSGPSNPVWETMVRPATRFGVATPNTGLFGQAFAVVRRFSGGSGRNSGSLLDREDYNLKTNAYHRTQRNSYSGILNFTRDSTLNSQLDQTGEVISSRATRSRLVLGPSWTGSLTQQTQLNLGYNFTTVSYSDEPDGQRLIAYDYDSFSASLTHQYTQRLQGSLSATYSSYQPDSGFDSDTLNLQVGISGNFSETLSTSLSAGYRETTSDTLIPAGFCINADPGAKFPGCKGGTPIQTGTTKDSNVNTGSVFNANITKFFYQGSLDARLSRASRPSSNGGLLDTTRLTLNGTYRFSSRLKSNLRVTYSNAETISGTGNDARQTDQTFFKISPELSWRWLRKLTLTARYEYIENENRNAQTARRNAVSLSITYSPNRISISR